MGLEQSHRIAYIVLEWIERGGRLNLVHRITYIVPGLKPNKQNQEHRITYNAPMMQGYCNRAGKLENMRCVGTDCKRETSSGT